MPNLFHSLIIIDEQYGRGLGIVGEIAFKCLTVNREGVHAIDVVTVEEEGGNVGGSDVGVLVEVRVGAFPDVALLAAKVDGNEGVMVLAPGYEVALGIKVKGVVVAKGDELRLIGAL